MVGGEVEVVVGGVEEERVKYSLPLHFCLRVFLLPLLLLLLPSSEC